MLKYVHITLYLIYILNSMAPFVFCITFYTSGFVRAEPECIPCDCPLTIKHVLIECVDRADIRKQYFNCPDLKTLFNSVAGDTILAYLSEINLISQI